MWALGIVSPKLCFRVLAMRNNTVSIAFASFVSKHNCKCRQFTNDDMTNAMSDTINQSTFD